MENESTLAINYHLMEWLIHMTEKRVIADCLTLLAINISQYRSIYGEIPLENVLATLGEIQSNSAQIEVMNEGLSIICSLLASQLIEKSAPTSP